MVKFRYLAYFAHMVDYCGKGNKLGYNGFVVVDKLCL